MNNRERPVWYYLGPLWLVLMPFVIAGFIWLKIYEALSWLF